MPHKDPDRRRAYKREQARRLRAARPGHDAALQRKRQMVKKATGVCAVCSQRAIQGQRLCVQHREQERERSHRRAKDPRVRDSHRRASRTFRVLYPDRAKERTVKYQAKHRALGLCVHCSRPATNGLKCATHPASQRQATRLYRYGLTVIEWQQLLDAAGHRCEVCGKTEQEIGGSRTERLIPDHDHDTGVVRGVLCWRCNVGIGLLGDSAGTVDRALSYLRRSPRKAVEAS